MKPKSRGNGQGTAYKRKNAATWTAQVIVGWKIPEDPAHIALIFKNDTRDFSLSKLSMTINIKADGRDVPYYTVENLYYPFMTPLKPGEEKPLPGRQGF